MIRIQLFGQGGGDTRRKVRLLTSPQYINHDDIPAAVRTVAALLAKSPTVAAACVRVQLDRLPSPSTS